jgi:hypothetical protein
VPGVTYSGIRGAYNFAPHSIRTRSRSLYGVGKPLNEITHIAKRFRLVGISKPEDIVSNRNKLKTNK